MEIKNSIRHYYQVYKGFISTSFTAAMGFRVNFFLLIFVDVCFFITSIYSVNIIFLHVDHIGSWNREQLLFFISIMLCVHQIHMTFISENFWLFSETLKSGKLDFAIVKPISSLFTTFFRNVRPGSFITIFVAGCILVYYGTQVPLSPLAWVLLPFCILLATFLTSSLDMLITCSMFWMLEGTGINFLRMELQELSRWPDYIYDSFTSRLLTVVIPILLIGNAPAKFLFDQSNWIPFAGMGLAIIVIWILLHFAWKLGLRFYESASS